MKSIVCLVHGLTDVALKDLGGLTPLQKAHIPSFDSLAQQGKTLSVLPPDKGGLDSALMAFLGKETSALYPSQGALEAYSLGYVLTPNQTAFSLRFVSMGQDTVIDVANDLLSDHEGKLLCRDLNMALGSQGCYFLHLKGPRAVLVSEFSCVPDALLSSNFNPLKAVGKRWQETVKGSQLQEMMTAAFEILEKHEINALKEDLEESSVNGFLLFDGGGRASGDKHSLIPEKNLLYTTSHSSLGLARLLNLNTLRWAPEQNKYEHLLLLMAKLESIMKETDFFCIEIHHLWKSTYKGELLEKVKGLEWLDRFVLSPLKSYCEQTETQLTLLPLKHTDIRSAAWLPGSVPAVVYNPKELTNHTVTTFDEMLLEKSKKKISLQNLLSQCLSSCMTA